MEYLDLYKTATDWIESRLKAEKEIVAVPFKYLKDILEKSVAWIEAINVYPIKCEEGDPLGHYELHGNRESRWDDDDAWVVLITYDQDLDDDNTTDNERLVWTKELMHVFDTRDGQISDKDRLQPFLSEIESPPFHDDRSTSYLTENAAAWKALLVLCPKKFRDEQKAKYDAGDITEYDVAAYFRIPYDVVKLLFSLGYDKAHHRFIDDDDT